MKHKEKDQAMTFDHYYSYLQNDSTSKRLNHSTMLRQLSGTARQATLHKTTYESLLDAKMIHIKGIVDHKAAFIGTHGYSDIQVVRDFYHYFYYYLFYKSRSLLIHRDCFDCSWHAKIKSRLTALTDPQYHDNSLDWLTRRFDHYKKLRTLADYYFDSSSILALITPQTLTEAIGTDWADLQGLTL